MTLHSDSTGTSHSNSNRLSSFDSNGFSIGTSGGDDGINANGSGYLAWCWDAGSSTVTNNDGTISSQVRANPTAGFSIVSYNGSGSNATIGHGLGVTPKRILLKDKMVEVVILIGVFTMLILTMVRILKSSILKLNSSDGQSGQSNIFNDTKPTSSVFSIGTHASNR